MYLTDLEIDALKESINIGVGYAASALNELVGSPVHLQVPELGILTLAQATERVESMGGGIRASIELGFSGVLTGSAALIFPADSAAGLAALLTEDRGGEADVDGLRAATLEETGNLVLNGVVGSIANLLHERISFSIPYFSEHPGLPPRLAGSSGSPEPHVIFARARFSIAAHEIEGDLFLFFETESVGRLKQALDQSIELLGG